MPKKQSARGANAGGGAESDNRNLADGHLGSQHTMRETKAQATETATHAEMCRVLALVCNVDMQLKGGYVGRVARQLRLAGYTVADVRFFWEWWGEADWRGRNNEYPRLGDVLTLIQQSRQAHMLSQAIHDGSLLTSTDKRTGELVSYTVNAAGERVEIARILPYHRRRSSR